MVDRKADHCRASIVAFSIHPAKVTLFKFKIFAFVRGLDNKLVNLTMISEVRGVTALAKAV